MNITDGLANEILNSASDAILFTDPGGLIRFWNLGAARIFGFTAEEAVGKSLDLVIPERLRARHWEGYERVMATGTTRYGAGDLLPRTSDVSRWSSQSSFSAALVID